VVAGRGLHAALPALLTCSGGGPRHARRRSALLGHVVPPRQHGRQAQNASRGAPSDQRGETV